MLLAKDHKYISFGFENKPCESASLFTSFYVCGVIEGNFALTKASLSIVSFL